MISKQIFIIFYALLFCSYSTNWTQLQNQIHQKINAGLFSGCVLGVFSNETTLYKRAFGTMTPKWGLYASPVLNDTTFDLQFLTQVTGINLALMSLYDKEKLSLTDRASKYVTDFDNNSKRYLTIQNLLLHNSGLQSTYNQDFGSTPEELLKKIDSLKLEYKQDSKFLFSELGYVVLGQLVSKISNASLDSSLFDILVFSGMRNTHYNPSNTSNIAPSGFINGPVQGKPGNRISNFLKGMGGNAGLFSTVDDIGTMMSLLLSRGKPKSSSRIFSEEVINIFTTKVVVKGYNNTRALGWDTVPVVDPPCGHKFSQHSFGLSDPSGSYIWADKDKNIAIVLLAAGGYPVNSGLNVGKNQGEISDAIMMALGY